MVVHRSSVPHIVTSPPHIRFVDRPVEVADALEDLGQGDVGVDVERADAHRYLRRAALVQVGRDDRCVLLDAVTLNDMPQLDAFLAQPRTTVLHAADNDLTPLARLGVEPGNLADTAIAAAMLGMPTGLEALLSDLLGVALDGDKSAYQRADWEQRPLPDDMATYAAGDVVHLPALWDLLAAQLAAEGRRDWHDQELAAAMQRLDDDTRSWRNVRGLGRLSPAQRSLARIVWEARETIARTHDLAPNHLLRDEAIVRIALDPPTTESGLLRRAQRRHPTIRTHAAELLEAVAAGLAADPDPPRSHHGRPMTTADRAAIEALRHARAEVAERLGIDAGVLCPAKPLATAVMSDPTDARSLCDAAGLRPWQTELLAAALWEAYLDSTKGATSAEGAPNLQGCAER